MPRTPNTPPRTRALARRASLLLAGALACGGAQALELHGVHLPEQTQQGASTLALNGAGTRSVLFFKVYVAGLYLPHPTHSASDALAMPGPKLMRLVMLREVSGKELGEKLDASLRANLTPARLAELAPSLARLHELFASQRALREGQHVELSDEPGTGVVLRLDGRALGEPLAQPGLFDALLRVWIGASPADASLKRELLGKAH